MTAASSIRLLTADLAFIDDSWHADAGIAIEGDSIVGAGSTQVLTAEFPSASHDHLGQHALVPGGVNGHGHTFQALVRGFADDLDFGDWMGGMVHPTAARLDAAALQIGARFDLIEMLRMGITTAVEFFYLHDRSNENALALLEAAGQVGMRTVLARCMFDADPGPERYRESLACYEQNFRALAGAFADDPLVEIHPAPHSVLGASAEMLELGSRLAHEYDTPLHVHVADNWGEVEASVARFGGTSVKRLADVGVLDERLLAVHAVAVDDADLDLLAAHGSTVVHNPSTNAFLGGGIAPVAAMRERGIPVCLGTDAAGANSRQSLFEEMRMAALLAKATTRSGTAMTATEALRLGTSAGGTALRMPVGRLSVSFKADVVALDLGSPSVRPLRTATQNVIYSMQPEAIRHVWVGGRQVVQDGEVTTLDVAEVLDSVERLTSAWAPVTGHHPLGGRR